MLWRLKAFWQPFWRILLWGDSKRKAVVKLIALALAIVGPSVISLFESPGYLYVYLLRRELISSPISFGFCLTILVALIWILLAAGRAYELAGVPELVIEDELVADTIGANTSFRLRLTAEQKDFETVVRLLEILDENCNPILPGRFPIELEWTHHPAQVKVELKAGIKDSVSVAMMRQITLGDYDLCYTGARHGGCLSLAVGGKAYYHVRIEHRRNRPIQRWFCFEKLDNVTFDVKRSGPPTPA